MGNENVAILVDAVDSQAIRCLARTAVFRLRSLLSRVQPVCLGIPRVADDSDGNLRILPEQAEFQAHRRSPPNYIPMPGGCDFELDIVMVGRVLGSTTLEGPA